MIDVKCPKCNVLITVKYNNGNIICPNCLATKGDSVIMVTENKSSPKIRNLGDGFFQKEPE